MKKRFLAALATGMIIMGVGSVAQALPTNGDFNPLFGTPIENYLVEDYSGITDTPFFDFGTPSQKIGYTGSTYTGIYLGTITETPSKGGGNQITEPEMTALISYFLGAPFDPLAWLKVDGIPGDATFNDNGTLVTLWVDSEDGNTGTWDITPINYGLNFYGVKGSNEYALYFVEPALYSGFWSTEHLTNGSTAGPQISHFAGTVENNPVPEPATMLLFGAGLAGLAGIARRKKKA